MKTPKHILIVVLISICYYSCIQSEQKQDCKNLKGARLQYIDAKDTSAYILIAENKHIEYYNDGQDSIVSKIEWQNDCEYNAIFLESSLPNFPYKPGKKLNVKFDGFEKDTVYCTTKVDTIIIEQRFKMTH